MTHPNLTAAILETITPHLGPVTPETRIDSGHEHGRIMALAACEDRFGVSLHDSRVVDRLGDVGDLVAVIERTREGP